MKFLLSLIVLLLASNSYTELPRWIRKDCELQAFSSLISALKDGPFYKIKSITSVEINTEPDEEHIETRIQFEDLSGCKNRDVIVECIPIDLESQTIFYREIVSDCAQNTRFQLDH